jgi:ATP-binding cassette subfamily B protein
MSASSSVTEILSEFTLAQRPATNRSSPLRWITSHTLRYWPLGISLLVGAFANAALAAAVPILIGRAFNAILASPPNTQALLPIALLIAATQFVRGALQFVRNFSAELFGQRLERDIRDERTPACWARA